MTNNPRGNLGDREHPGGYGFTRTACACRRCTISCEHVPGALAPPDLPRIAAHLGHADVQQFARENLLASEGAQVTDDRGRTLSLPTLVPAMGPGGGCRFLAAGRCTIHAVSPFGCAFIDAHQSDREYRLRADALYRDLANEWNTGGAYARVWEDLRARGLVAAPLATRQYWLGKAMRREKLL